MLDRVQLVVQTGTNTFDVEEFERWAQLLDGMVLRVLDRNLASRTVSSTFTSRSPSMTSSRLWP